MCVTPDLPETKPEKEIPTTFESQKAKKVLLMDQDPVYDVIGRLLA